MIKPIYCDFCKNLDRYNTRGIKTCRTHANDYIIASSLTCVLWQDKAMLKRDNLENKNSVSLQKIGLNG